MKKKQLTEAQIIEIEKWAESKKKSPHFTEEESKLLSIIESNRENGWAGWRKEENYTAEEKVKKDLEKLKNKKL